MDQAHTAAARLLLSEMDATAESIRHAACRHLSHLLPENRTVLLRRTPTPDGDHYDIEVSMLPEDAATPGASRERAGRG